MPTRLRPSYDSGDHLHAGAAGFAATAAAVALGVMPAPVPVRRSAAPAAA